jgi:hypothetical protein
MAGTTWPSLTPNTKARASDVEAKFDWIEGDIVPMVNGTRVDNAYDLGDATYRWRDIRIARQILLPAGSAGMPSFSRQGVTTGVYFPTTTAVGIAVNGTAVQISYADGNLKPTQPIFRATSNGAVTMSASGLVTFPTVSINVGGLYSSTDSTMIVPMNGRYMLFAAVPMYSSTITSYTMRLRLNGTSTSNDLIAYSPENLSRLGHPNICSILELSVGTTVDCFVARTGGGEFTVCPSSFNVRHFGGYLVG